MSKSIYDEALKEISEQKEAWGVRIRSIVPTQLDMISKALEQGQKQEKFITQIKEIIDRPHTYIASMLESSNRFFEIEKLIKELENE